MSARGGDFGSKAARRAAQDRAVHEERPTRDALLRRTTADARGGRRPGVAVYERFRFHNDATPLPTSVTAF